VSGEAISAGLQDHDYGSDSKEWVVFMLMSVGIFVKMVLQVYCNAMNKTADGKTKSEMLDALADDHLNDIWSNFAALGCLLTAVYTKLWWMDPAGAIVISAVIVYRWADIIRDQTEMMVGLTANDEMIEDLVKLAQNHDDRIVSIDRTIAYFFGSKYNVEMDIILPGDFSLEEAHDIGISLQNELEEVEEVARAIVHVSGISCSHLRLLCANHHSLYCVCPCYRLTS
jgi:divalent metal cation (Fe/Co/Zn/Cd) transporter